MMGFGGIFGILLIGLIVWAVIYVTNQNREGKPFPSGGQIPKHDEDEPTKILKKRYASGEISKEEYERMKDEIS